MEKPTFKPGGVAVARILVAALIAGALVVGLMPAAVFAASPLYGSNVFDPKQTGWHYRTNMTLAEYKAYFDEQTKSRIQIDIEVEVIDGQATFAAVFQDNVDGRSQYVLRDMSKAAFDANNADQRKAGKRLVDVEIYPGNAGLLYAAIWLGNKENLDHHLTEGMTEAELNDYAARMRREGFLPIDVEMYDQAVGDYRYAVIWLKNSEGLPWKLLVGLSDSEFGTNFETLKREYRPIDVEGDDAGKPVYSVIWVGNPSKRLWYERRDMDETTFDNYKRLYEDLGYRITDVEAYVVAGQLRYAGIWRQNSDRPHWELRPTFDGDIEQAVEDWKLPGMAVVVMKNGQTLYRRGFGFADIAGGRWWDSETTGRLASISKAITGTLAVDLDSAGILDLDDPISQWLPIPANHNYTVGDLGSNAACIAHTGDLDDQSFMGSQYDTSLEAAEQFWDDPSVFVCTPPSATDNYSTPGYTLQGAALEAATGVDLATLVEQTYSVPLGLTTLRAEDPDTAYGRRTVLYKLNDDEELEEIERDNMSWKLGGGGFEASPVDVARWGAALMAGDIVDAAGLTELWDSPFAADNYANGWNLGSELGRQVVAKTGGQPGAKTYIRMYPEEQVVIVVMINRDALDDEPHFAQDMGKQLGTKVLNWIDGV